MVLLDARSARDKTVLLCYYLRPVYTDMLPPYKKGETWHAFRIPYTQVAELFFLLPAPLGRGRDVGGHLPSQGGTYGRTWGL